MKKLIALLVLAFVVTAASIGCSGTTTTGGGVSTNRSSSPSGSTH